MTEPGPLSASELDAIDAWWRAANYLSVGQIYLLGNPLLAEPLRPEHVEVRARPGEVGGIDVGEGCKPGRSV